MQTMYQINQEALSALENLEYAKAQSLFLKNAKKFPCHETFHNWGYFLITEGLQCRNGVRDATLLGWEYLQKADQMKKSALTALAITCAIDRGASHISKKYPQQCTAKYAFETLSWACQLYKNDILEYNRLRFWYYVDPQNIRLQQKAEDLLISFQSRESILLYLSVLCMRGNFDLCLDRMKQFDCYLETDDKLVLYYLCEKYELCAKLYAKLNKYSLLEAESAMLIESLIYTNNLDDAKEYAERVSYERREMLGNRQFQQQWGNILKHIEHSTPYRQKLIASYQLPVPYIDVCCYYGCKRHHAKDPFAFSCM